MTATRTIRCGSQIVPVIERQWTARSYFDIAGHLDAVEWHDMERQRFVTRHELWRRRYRNARDLNHLPPEALSERLFDCMNNARARTDQGQLGLVPVPSGEDWWIRFTEVLEECALRGYDYPGPINVSTYADALEHAFAPIPNVVPYLGRLRRGGYLLKFGKSEHLKAAFENGEFLLSPASYYERHEHNHARRDRELSRTLIPNPRNPAATAFLSRQKLSVPQGKIIGSIELREQFDYYLFSLTAGYNSRLFGDFDANACLLIYDPAAFLQRIIDGMKRRVGAQQCEIAPVKYYDPVRVDPVSVDVPFWKPFSHSYQSELRVIWPSDLELTLPRIDVEIGSLKDCAYLITL